MDYLIYKKSLDGKELFSESEEYESWEKIMAEYLLPFSVDLQSPFKQLRPYRVKHKQQMNMCGQVQLLAYCLMPTYIYMVLREIETGGVTSFVRKISTYYSMLYNKKRDRKGYVFEGSYKKKEILTQVDLERNINLVHLLPMSVRIVKKFGVVQTSTGIFARDYLYSSMRDYLSLNPRKWVTVLKMETKDKEEGKLPW